MPWIGVPAEGSRQPGAVRGTVPGLVRVRASPGPPCGLTLWPACVLSHGNASWGSERGKALHCDDVERGDINTTPAAIIANCAISVLLLSIWHFQAALLLIIIIRSTGSENKDMQNAKSVTYCFHYSFRGAVPSRRDEAVTIKLQMT